jgi:hypothetical protein
MTEAAVPEGEDGLTVARLQEFLESTSPPQDALVYISIWDDDAEGYIETPVRQLNVSVRWDGPSWMVLRSE